MRPLDALAVTYSNGRALGSGTIASMEPRENALGGPVCAVCRDREAVPVLAGDRAYGPDHLYLICDRCGSRWQRFDS